MKKKEQKLINLFSVVTVSTSKVGTGAVAKGGDAVDCLEGGGVDGDA